MKNQDINSNENEQARVKQQPFMPMPPIGQMMPMQDLYNMPITPIQMPYFPTGLPLGQQTSPMPIPGPTPTPPGAMTDQGIARPPLFSGENTAETTTNTQFTAGFLKTLIGRIVVVDFLIGSNTLVDRTGQLVQVGASYIVLRDIISSSYTMCDLYSIKFVRIYR